MSLPLHWSSEQRSVSTNRDMFAAPAANECQARTSQGFGTNQPTTFGCNPMDLATAESCPHTFSQFASNRYPSCVITDSG